MRVIAWDTETDAFRPGLQSPPIVCLQWCEVTAVGCGVGHVVDEQTGLGLLWDWLCDPEVHLVGAEVSYDVLCAVTSATNRSPEMGHALMTKFVEAYDADRISDILIRQKLLDLARGCYRYERGDNGETIDYNTYSLAGLARRHLKINLDKDTIWRKNYHTLRGIPIDQWPLDAVTYARDDATATGGVWLAQWRPSVHVSINFPSASMSDVFADEFRQARAALWIKAMSAYGIKTDPKAIEIFKKYVEEDYAECLETLVAAGLARKDYHFDRKRAVQYVQARPALAALATETHKSGPPTIKLGAKERALLAVADPTLSCLLDPGARTDLSIPAGLVTVTEHRNTKAAKDRMIQWHRARGTVPTITKSGVTARKESPSTFNAEDYVALDKDACQTTQDDLLEAYAEMTHLAKILSTDLPALAAGVGQPIHSHFESILETGRTSSSKPNVQNQARGKKDRIGARECFVPRPGKVLIDSDYSQLELYTLAQACIWMLGKSSLAEALRSGVDAHTKVGARIAGITYEQAVALKDAKDPDFDNVRNCAKPLNFGKPGGLGADTMMSFAAKGYGVKRPREFWAEAIAVFMQTWPEMKDYFAAISALEGQRGTYNVVQPWSRRLRAGATYCSACNSIFQGLGSDVAKLAGWFLFKACYVDRNSPLFGSRIVLFIHDQFMIEIDESKAAAGAAETERLMNLAGSIVLPDCPVKCEPILARRYSKMAKATHDANGNLTAWEDVRLAAKAAA